jgi:hypothetical protein
MNRTSRLPRSVVNRLISAVGETFPIIFAVISPAALASNSLAWWRGLHAGHATGPSGRHVSSGHAKACHLVPTESVALFG